MAEHGVVDWMQENRRVVVSCCLTWNYMWWFFKLYCLIRCRLCRRMLYQVPLRLLLLLLFFKLLHFTFNSIPLWMIWLVWCRRR